MSDEKIVRMPIPPAIYRNPECPLCEQGLDFEEGWVCTACRVFWPEHGLDSVPGEVDGDWEPRPQCPAEIEPYKDSSKFPHIAGYRFRCVREEGHDPAAEDRAVYRAHVGVRVDEGSPDPMSLRDWTEKIEPAG